MNGRVARLLVFPLLTALDKTIGKSDYLDFMKSFKYPLMRPEDEFFKFR